MTPIAVKPRATPDSVWHRLLKVVAIVDPRTRRSMELLRQHRGRSTTRSRSAATVSSATSPKTPRSAPTSSLIDGEQLEPRASWRVRCARSAFARRCGRWPTRTASPTWRCWAGVGEVDGYIYLGQQSPTFYAKQVVASLVNYGMIAAAAVLRRPDDLRRRRRHRVRLPGPPGRPVLSQVAGRAAVLQALRRERSSATTCATPTSTSATC